MPSSKTPDTSSVIEDPTIKTMRIHAAGFMSIEFIMCSSYRYNFAKCWK